MSWFRGFTNLEWRILTVSLLMMMACAFFLANDRLVTRLSSGLGRSPDLPLAAVLNHSGAVTVSGRAVGAQLSAGDVVAVEDKAVLRVRLPNRAEVEVTGPAALRAVRFEGTPAIDHLLGTFRWTYPQDFNVLIRGRKAILSGTNGNMELVLDEKGTEPAVRALTQGARLQMADRPSTGAPTAPEILPMESANFFYVWRFDDLFERAGAEIRLKTDSPLEVPVSLRLNWDHPSASGPFSVQISAGDQARYYSAGEQSLQLERAFLGENQWRVGFEDQVWSRSDRFNVEARFLPASLRFSAPSKGKISWRSEPAFPMYIIEWNEKSDFPLNGSKWKWLETPEFEISSPGSVYLKVRGVSATNELSEWSSVTRWSPR